MSTVKDTTTIGELSDKLQYTDLSQQVRSVLEHIGVDPTDYGMVFVDTENGEYIEVWASHGCVPYTHKTAYRLV